MKKFFKISVDRLVPPLMYKINTHNIRGVNVRLALSSVKISLRTLLIKPSLSSVSTIVS